MERTVELLTLITEAFDSGIIKKLVFSRPRQGEVAKISGRLCEHRGRRILALELSLPDNTVSHKNIGGEALSEELTPLTENYRQINLITTLGDVEWRISSSGKEALLGGDKLHRKMSGDLPDFARAVEALDNKKNYILRGDEDFLVHLGISDSSGRVHDKRQGKFRQINRFLEHIRDIYDRLPDSGELIIYDLCCGKSYLSFAVYYYLTAIRGRQVSLLGIDRKRDVVAYCAAAARTLGYTGMRFVADDVRATPRGVVPHMVISLHACDIATDLVLNCATELGAEVILSTPCCHRYLNGRISNESLSFVTKHPHLRNKLCEAITDALRIARLEAAGYSVSALELTDPDDTPKNTLIRAVRERGVSQSELDARASRYEGLLRFTVGEGADSYLSEIE